MSDKLTIDLRKVGREVALELRNELPPVQCTVAPADVLDIVLDWLPRAQLNGELVEVRAGPRLVGVATNRRLLLAIVQRAVGLVSIGLAR